MHGSRRCHFRYSFQFSGSHQSHSSLTDVIAQRYRHWCFGDVRPLYLLGAVCFGSFADWGKQMARKCVVRTFLLVVASLVLVPALARAQSVFTGTVKDTSGAVMPGVTVEAASPVLIEKVKSTITDESGLYRIVDLRPGTYTLTFTLPGIQHGDPRRASSCSRTFTATINIELSVGTLQESVTVSGASPVVDVSQNVKQQVLTREVLDAVPTAKTIQGIGQLVLGVTLNSPDVGGSRAMQQTYFAIRGTGGAQSVVLVDGLMTNGLMGDGAVQAYHNEAMSQEMVYQTSGGAAETLTGGITMNLVPKDGGNQFRGGAKWAKSPEVVAGRQLYARTRGDGRHRRRQDQALRGIQHRAGRPDHQEQAVVLRRVPPGLLRQADRQHLPDRRQRGVSAGGGGVHDLKELRARRLRREDGQPGCPSDLADFLSATSSPSIRIGRCVCGVTPWVR
jgi:hypothetical protein